MKHHGPPLHAARDIIDEVVGMVGKIHIIQKVCDPLFSFLPGEMMQSGMKLQILTDGQIPVETEVLLNYAEAAVEVGKTNEAFDMLKQIRNLRIKKSFYHPIICIKR